jgi:predicted regulator of Ras-like GTPase activity (Roadblock/LC7/MglB family)
LPKPFFVGDLPSIVGQAMGTGAPEAPQATLPELTDAAPDRSNSTPVRETLAAASVVLDSPPEQGEAASPGEAPAHSAETTARLQAKEREIVQLLKGLNREVRAESIMVTLGEQLIAFAGLLGREQTANLAGLVSASTEAAARSAAFLGEPDGRFEQSLHEGNEYRLYSLSVAEGLVLSLALSSDVPLGTLRYRARQTAEELLELLM